MKFITIILTILSIGTLGYVLFTTNNISTKPGITTLIKQSAETNAVNALVKAYDTMIDSAGTDMDKRQTALIYTKRLFNDVERNDISDDYLGISVSDLIPDIAVFDKLGQTARQQAVRQAYNHTLQNSTEFAQLRMETQQRATGLKKCLIPNPKKSISDMARRVFFEFDDALYLADTVYLLELLYETEHDNISEFFPLIELNDEHSRFLYSQSMPRYFENNADIYEYIENEIRQIFELDRATFLTHSLLISHLPYEFITILKVGTQTPEELVKQAKLLTYELNTNVKMLVNFKNRVKSENWTVDNLYKSAGLDIKSDKPRTAGDIERLLKAYNEGLGAYISNELKRAGGRGKWINKPEHCIGIYD